MQKVSKQSLAMLALSILLAISVALTLTFAALSNTKTATGTITFSGNVALIVDSTTNISASTRTDDPYSFTVSDPTTATEINNALAAVSYKLAATSQNAYIKVVATTSNESAVALTPASASGYLSSSLTQTSSSAISAGETQTLGALYTAGLDLTALDGSSGAIADVTLTFTITAQTQAF